MLWLCFPSEDQKNAREDHTAGDPFASRDGLRGENDAQEQRDQGIHKGVAGGRRGRGIGPVPRVTGEDSWILEIAVIDVEHLDAVVTKFCILAETSTSIVLNVAREHAAVLPARRENIKPVIRKVTGK